MRSVAPCASAERGSGWDWEHDRTGPAGTDPASDACCSPGRETRTAVRDSVPRLVGLGGE